MGAPEPSNARPPRSDGAEAVRYLAIKAAIFILVPLVATVIAVVFWMPG